MKNFNIMEVFTKKILTIAVVFLLFGINLYAQNQEELFIEQLGSNEAVDIQGSNNCEPGSIIITVKSDIPYLIFDSNVIDITNVSYRAETHEYVFCHKNGSFIMTVGSPYHISKEIFVDGRENKYAFKIVAKQPTGKIFFKTNPNNAYVDFNREGLSPQLTSTPITMNAGEYNVRISKVGYFPLDTTIIVPSDGSTKMMDINLKQNFARIRLDISTSDGGQFQMYPIIEIDTAHINMTDLFDNSKLKSFDDEGSLEYFKIYKGGYIPVPEGAYNVTVSSPGFRSYATTVQTTKGTIYPLTVKLQTITGFLNVIDNGNATGAKIILNDKEIGTVPLFNYSVRAGVHKLRFAKPGYLTSENEYKVTITEDVEEDWHIAMSVFKEFFVMTNPSGAEVLINKKREGFSPVTVYLKEGTHDMLIKRVGYLDENQKITVSAKGNNKPDTIKYDMLMNYPLTIKSEEDGLSIFIKKNNRLVLSDAITPADIQLPYGDYSLVLKKDKSKRFSGTFTHNGKKNLLTVPSYSYGTFTMLSGNYFPGENMKLLSENGNRKYSLLANLQLGRFVVFPGLSTSIFRVSVFNVNQNFSNTFITDEGAFSDKKYDDYMFAGTCLFLNGEFRMGGSIIKNLDICALGTYAWYPKIDSFLSKSHINGSEMFFGIELSTRISYFNLNVKLGKEIYNGSYSFHKDKPADQFFSQEFNYDGFTLMVGFTLGQRVSASNNMLRLWNKPLFYNY